MDGNGNFIGGTEIRALVPWAPRTVNAKLYAGNGYWMDTPGPEGFQTAQVLVLDSSHGTWQQDVNFGSFCPTNAPRCALATSTLDNLHFTSDKNGTPVKVNVLVASTWDARKTRPSPVNVYAKNNGDGFWYETVLSINDADGAGQVRAFAAHVDSVTGQDWAFAGEIPNGIYHGLLSDLRGKGRNIIEWTTGENNVEWSASSYTGPKCKSGKARVTSFAEAGGGKLYAAVCFQILVRVDGDQGSCKLDQVLINGKCEPRWKVFWTDDKPVESESGLRGLTNVNFQGKQVLLVGEEGGVMRIIRIDPDTGLASVEVDAKNSLTNGWNMDVIYGIVAYNNMPSWTTSNGALKRIIGLEAFFSRNTLDPRPKRSFNLLAEGGKLEGNGWYILRNAADSFQLVRIPNVVDTPMVAVRTAAQSPFADECDANGRVCAMYFGGFDANKSSLATPCSVPPCTFPPLIPVNVHNTAWIAKSIGPQ
jgi:hypothetical protein